MRKPWIEVQEEDYRDFHSLDAGLDSMYFFKNDFTKMIDKDKKILEVGCGNGYFLEFLKAFGYYKVTGIDVVKKALEDSIKRCPFHIFRMDGHQMTFENETFDAVVACHVIEHSPIPTIMLNEIHRVLKPGGLVFFEVPLEKYCDENTAHFSNWETPEEFIKFISPKFDIIKQNMFRWFMVIGVKK